MGMYTELVIKCHIKRNLPDTVNEILNCMFNGTEEPEHLPDHLFFKCPRWNAVGSCSSYYHIPESLSFYREGYLFSRSDLKNYDDEIDLFLNWVKKYVDELPDRCIGWTWYEEDDSPELIYNK